jgi:hypothetical protein
MKGMDNGLKFILLAAIVLFQACGARNLETDAINSRDFNIMNNSVVNNRRQINPTEDPCWYTSGEKFFAATEEMRQQYLELIEIERYGYKSDTPLKEAIKIFNEAMRCDGLFREYPPITEDEVLAAIVEGVNENGRREVYHAERDVFWSIAVKKIIPKGTALKARGGGQMSGSPLAPDGFIQTVGVEIYFQLNADKNGRDELPPIPEPQEYLIIRKTFSGVKINP